MLVFLYRTTPADPDLFGHVTFGGQIHRLGWVPYVDSYSYTAAGHDWINHEWLSEWIFYLFYRLGGFGGIHLLKTLYLVATSGLFYLTYRRVLGDRFPIGFYPLLSLAWILMYPFVQVRPQLFTFTLMQILILLFLIGDDETPLALYAIPFLFLPWVNLHGGVVAGVGLLGLLTVSSLFLRSHSVPRMLFVLGASVLVTTLNPYEIGMHRQIAEALLNPYTPRVIQDWLGLTHAFVHTHPAVLVALVVFAGHATWFAYSQKRRADGIWFILSTLMLVAGLRNVRNLVFYPLVGFPSWCLLLRGGLASASGTGGGGTGSVLSRIPVLIREGGHRYSQYVLPLVLGAIFVGCVAGGKFVVNPGGRYPEKSVEYLRSRGVRGNLAVPFNEGQYCVFYLSPRMRVSLDGRYDTVYPLEVFEEFQFTVFQGKPGWRRVLIRYGTDYVLVPHHFALREKLRSSPGARLRVTEESFSVYELTDEFEASES